MIVENILNLNLCIIDMPTIDFFCIHIVTTNCLSHPQMWCLLVRKGTKKIFKIKDVIFKLLLYALFSVQDTNNMGTLRVYLLLPTYAHTIFR
jgi:hypothetical protein